MEFQLISFDESLDDDPLILEIVQNKNCNVHDPKPIWISKIV